MAFYLVKDLDKNKFTVNFSQAEYDAALAVLDAEPRLALRKDGLGVVYGGDEGYIQPGLRSFQIDYRYAGSVIVDNLLQALNPKYFRVETDRAFHPITELSDLVSTLSL